MYYLYRINEKKKRFSFIGKEICDRRSLSYLGLPLIIQDSIYWESEDFSDRLKINYTRCLFISYIAALLMKIECFIMTGKIYKISKY